MIIVLLIALFVCNFSAAYLIKLAELNLFKKFIWLKYIMIIPPFGLSIALIYIFYDVIKNIPKTLREYFKD